MPSTSFISTSGLLRVMVATVAAALVVTLGLSSRQPTFVSAQTGDVFFSEYVEGSSLNKAVEIYNGTGGTVDLNAGGYRVEIYSNGSTSASTVVALTGSVVDGDVYVVADDGADSAILSETDQTSTASFFNGDDAVVLRKGGAGGAIVDVIGEVGFDPGSQWGSGLISTADNTIRRVASVCDGDTNPNDDFEPDTNGEWEGFANDTFDGLGAHTANCMLSTATPTATATTVPATATPTATATASATAVPPTATATATASATAVPPTATPTATNTATTLPTSTATPQPTSTATVAASPTPAGQIADPITNAALTLSMSPAVSSQLQNLANQINSAVAAALLLGPPQDQYIYNAQRRVLDLWINTLVPLFVQQGQIPASSQAGVLDALIMVRNALP